MKYFITVMVCLMIGAFAGHMWTAITYEERVSLAEDFAYGTSNSAMGLFRVQLARAMLTQLRAGETNKLINTWETQLDYGLLQIINNREWFDMITDEVILDTNSYLGKIRAYRTIYPPSNSNGAVDIMKFLKIESIPNNILEDTAANAPDPQD